MKKIITLLFATLFATAIYAAEITYRVASYNSDTDDFVLEAWGEKPEGASAYFFNDYGTIDVTDVTTLITIILK